MCDDRFVIVVIVVWVSFVKPAFHIACATEFAIESRLLLMHLLVIAVLLVNLLMLIKQFVTLSYSDLRSVLLRGNANSHLLDIRNLTQMLMSYLCSLNESHYAYAFVLKLSLNCTHEAVYFQCIYKPLNLSRHEA